MTVVRYEPWALLNRLHRELEQNFESQARDATWTPAVDINEEAGRFVVRADLPGVKPANINVTAEKGVLTPRGERSFEKRDADGRYFPHRACERQVRTHVHAAGERVDGSESPRSSRMACSSSRSPKWRRPSRARSRFSRRNRWRRTAFNLPPLDKS